MTIVNIIIAIIILGILVFVHELGHFLIAKLCGVYVEKFSIGFGPRLLGKKVGETEYCLSAFPLGGYVKMYGEGNDDDENKEDDQNKPVKIPDESKIGRSFAEKKPWQRAAIVIAGPLFNVILAIFIFWGLFMAGIPSYSPIVGSVEKASPAYMAGLKVGDKIAALDGHKIRSWNEFAKIITDSPNKKITITLSSGKNIEMNTRAVETANVFGEKEKVGDIGANLFVPPVIGTLQQGMPASKAGMKNGDKIVTLNNIKISDWTQAAEYIRGQAGKTIKIEILRGKSTLNLYVTPKLSEIKDEKGKTIKVGLLGISPTEGDIILKYGIVESMKLGFEKSYDFTKLIVLGFVKLIERVIPANSLGGPILIVQMTAQSAQAGFSTLLIFMAAISMNLAIFNILPIPVLDGGHLLIIIIEAITRRKLSEKVVGSFQMVGFILLICLMIFAFYNDIMRFFTK